MPTGSQANGGIVCGSKVTKSLILPVSHLMDAVIFKTQHMILKDFIDPKLSDIKSLRHILSMHPCGFINAMHLHQLIRRNPLDALLIYITTSKREHLDPPVIEWIEENIRTSPYLNN
jgi:hypothetical protein